MPRRLLFFAFIFCFFSSLLPPPIQAEPVVITALIPARPEHFQLELTSQPTSSTSIAANQTITFTLNYGSYLSQPTDTIILVISWQQQPPQPNLIHYVANSATPAIQGSQPHYDPIQRTLTWSISPMPPGANRQISWQLLIDPQQHLTTEQLFTINAQLTGPGVQIIATPLQFTYQPSLTPVQSTPQATQPPSSEHPTEPQQLPPTQLTQPSPTIASPTIGQPTIPATSNLNLWLIGLIVAIMAALLAWLIHKRLPLRLYLLWHHKTLVEGQILLNQQPLSNAQLRLKQNNRLISQITTNRHGYWSLPVATGRYQLHVQWQDKSSPQKESLTIEPKHHGHILWRVINLLQ